MDPQDPLGVDPLLEAQARWDAELAEIRRRWDIQYPTSAPAAPSPAPPAPGEGGGRPHPAPGAVPPLAGWCEDRRPGAGITDDDGVD